VCITIPFRNRTEAGRLLAAELGQYRGCSNVLVLGLPRDGVPVAFEVASALQATLDVLLVRKLGAPGRKELAVGPSRPTAYASSPVG
jgi:putative phosphoribosyl transferase